MSAEQLTILAVEDDRGDAEILRRNLAQIPGIDVDFMHVPSVEEAEAAMSRVGVDLAFVDYLLGARTGLEFIRDIRASGDLRPVICLTGKGDERVATDVLHAGADDYLVKSDVTPESLRRAIGMSTSHSNQRRLEEQNKLLFKELQTKNEILEKNVRHVAEMYEIAHQFVDDVSHEFRTPLTVIKEFTSILFDGLTGPINAEQREYLGIVLNRVDDLSALIDDMLDISKMEAGLFGVRRKACSVTEIFDHIRATLECKAATRKITLDIDFADDLPTIYCDPEKIGRVIVNLMVNAIKFSRESGNVRLSATCHSNQSQVVFAVTDQGPGIHPDSVDELFQRFKQMGTPARTACKGFGLGLNIAKELVHLNLGNIGVESKVGQGSTFSFTVPTAEPSRLITHFLRRVEAFHEGSSFASLLSAQVNSTIRDESRDEIEQFIQNHVRANDLVFRTRPNVWLLVLTNNRRHVDGALRRLHDAWVEENRNRSTPLDDIELNNCGTWALPSGKKELTERFKLECNEQGATHG